jgi:hypothetical protein
MNQRTIIYIILSAILLYLYYRRRDLAIFAVFIVVVGATLIFGDGSTSEGFGGGGGDKVDSACAKMGFTAPKIVKDGDGDIGESLEKEMKKINKVANKYWPYDERGDAKDEADKTSIQEFVGVYMKEIKDNELSKEDIDNITMFTELGKELYYKVYNPDEKKRGKITLKPSDLPKGYIKEPFISGGNKILKLLENVSKSSELKDEGAKKLVKYVICLCKHWIAILKIVDGMSTGKKSGSGKKKKDDEDAGGGDDDEEKPKKKKKKAKKEEDAENDE